MTGDLPTTFPPSKDDPTSAGLTEEQAMELALLKLPDPAWKFLEGKWALAQAAETGKTGIANVDAFYERRAAAKAAARAAATAVAAAQATGQPAPVKPVPVRLGKVGQEQRRGV